MKIVFKKKGDDRFRVMRFLARAIRPHLEEHHPIGYIFVSRIRGDEDNVVLVTTDAHVLNWITVGSKEFGELTEGLDDCAFFKVVSSNEDEVVVEKHKGLYKLTFPKWESVVPEGYDFLLASLMFPDGDPEIFSNSFYRLCRQEICLNVKYLKYLDFSKDYPDERPAEWTAKIKKGNYQMCHFRHVESEWEFNLLTLETTEGKHIRSYEKLFWNEKPASAGGPQ